MKISLVTVCRNGIQSLASAMESVVTSVVDGYELEYIVVDGASTDGTPALLAEKEDAFRRAGIEYGWISEPDRGIYDAMNKGIRRATGDVVGILNADDVLAADDVLGKIAAMFAGDPELEAIYGDIRFVKPQRDLAAMRTAKTVRYVSGRLFRKWMFRFAHFPPHPSTFIRRECFERFGYYNPEFRISGDFDLLVRFMLKGGIRTRYSGILTTVMTYGGVSTSSSRHAEMEKEDVRSLKSHGIATCRALTWLRYPYKLVEFAVSLWK